MGNQISVEERIVAKESNIKNNKKRRDLFQELFDEFEPDSEDIDLRQKQKKKRNIFKRPDYWESCWGRMLKRGDFANMDSRDSKNSEEGLECRIKIFLHLLNILKSGYLKMNLMHSEIFRLLLNLNFLVH